MRRLAIALVVVAAFGLTACENQEDPSVTNMRLGKQCADAGGSWTWSDWSGYHCTFKGK